MKKSGSCIFSVAELKRNRIVEVHEAVLHSWNPSQCPYGRSRCVINSHATCWSQYTTVTTQFTVRARVPLCNLIAESGGVAGLIKTDEECPMSWVD